MFIASKWNPIYWNTACLIVNSGSLEDNTEEELVDIYADEYQDLKEGVQFIDLPDKSAKIKRKVGTDYAKMAKAIGDIISANIKVSLVDINKSGYSFEPDVINNQILFGMKALSGVGDPIIEKIVEGRPYTSFVDFMNRCPLNKTAMITLIKSGAFDSMGEELGKELGVHPRQAIMGYYIVKASEPKTKLTLQNFSTLMKKGLIPPSLNLQKYISSIC
jgi:DNA polymerase-3 subunit alpha